MTLDQAPVRSPNAALLVRLHLAGMTGVLCWGLIMLAFGNHAGAIIELIYLLLLIPSVLWVHFTERHIVPDVWANITGVFLNGIAMTWVCDGVVGSGAFIGWSIICPMAAMVWVGLRASLITSAFYVALMIALTLFGQALPGGAAPPTAALPWMVTYNLVGGFSLVLLTLGWFIARLDDERRQNLANQERLLESQRHESLATLAGGVAHDFNNAFMAISGNLQLAERDLDPDSPLLMRFGQIRGVLDQAAILAHQMLAYASGGAPKKSSAPVAETIENAARFVLSGSPVRLEFERQGPLCAVEVDHGQIARVVQQLVTNAAQAMPEGGTVALRLGERTRDHRGPAPIPAGQRCLVLEVRDAGHGIPRELIPRLFDPFFTTRAGRTGLGLTEAFTVVRDHGGAIEVDSDHGRGSTFRVWLPIHRADEPAREAPAAPCTDRPAPAAGPAPPPKPGLPPTVLVMDDEATVLEVMREMLLILGYRVIATADGAAALAAWDSAGGPPPALAIFDLTVRGGMGGVEAARLLRQRDPGALIIASSGYASDRALSDYRAHGFDAVLRKPYRLEELRDTVETLLGARAPAAEA
ncbi:MAG: ATP-binding protein [Pseudomonadota bacterium]